MNDHALKAVITKLCRTALDIEPLFIMLYQDGLLIKANTGHEYFIDTLKINSEQELKDSLTNLYCEHKVNNTH